MCLKRLQRSLFDVQIGSLWSIIVYLDHFLNLLDTTLIVVDALLAFMNKMM
jgi:hypothetical protein